MTSLSSVLFAGLSSMRASQTALGVTSQNIANANTPGYVRADVALSPRSMEGAGAGVEVSGIRRAADRFLATASYLSESKYGASQARSDLLTRAQAGFGDPTSASSMFSSLDSFWAALAEIGVDPSSTLRRDDAVDALQSMFGEVQRVATSIQSLIGEADQRVADAVDETQALIDRIADLNKEIQLTKRSGADSSGAENAQSALIDELSKIVDIRASPVSEGGVAVRTGGGALLVGAQAAQLTYTPNSSPFAQHGAIGLNAQLGVVSNLEPMISGGELAGLLQARDGDLVDLAEALGGFSGAIADVLNEIHNNNSSTPAVSSMEGRQTGLLSTDALNFTGVATINLLDSDGDVSEQLTIDFTNSQITSSAGTVSFTDFIGDTSTANTFVEVLDGVLAASTPSGSAEFQDGVLSISVAGNNGIVIQQGADPNAADRAGRGFSHFFGLNDLVSRPAPLFFESGISGGDDHGFAGGGITFQVRDNVGRSVAQRTVSISGALIGGDWNGLIGALNNTSTGVGAYGSFALDSTTGRLAFTPISGYDVQVVSDSTERGTTGVSFSALHGLDQAATAGRALEINVASAIANDPGRLAVGRPATGAAIGDRMIESGDNLGAQALLDGRNTTRRFPAAGSMSAQSTSLSLYAARLGGEAGRIANDALRETNGAKAVATAAADRRAQVEGVSIDDELVKMTQYQNAYAAAARVIQAATDMFDILLSMGIR
jgi:flagellar hook-associated protein 1 FlgK